jgi:hypothetical protein
VDGVLYTLGNVTVNGGGNAINVTGGIFAGGNVTMNGGTIVTYNQAYMDSIDALQPPAGMNVLSWDEIDS